MSRLTDFTKTLQSKGVPFMEGRTKGDTEELLNKTVTVDDYAFLRNEDDGEYAVFSVKEIPESFYFGSTVITENLKRIEEEGLHDDVVKEGLKVKVVKRQNKKGNRTYTAFEF